MAIDAIVVDGHGTGKRAKVSDEGELNIVVHPHPPREDNFIVEPFRQYMTDDGTIAGSNDMTVDGSVTAVDFFISANQNFDIYIKSISVVIGDDGSPALNKYGAIIGGLTTGVQWCIFTQEDGLYELHDGIKTNLEFIRIGVDTAGIGDGTSAFLADVSGGGTEKSYLPIIDMSETFGMQYGVRLRKGTTDKIIFTINDDLTSLVTHNAIAYGIRF